jgi:hypothetical protein
MRDQPDREARFVWNDDDIVFDDDDETSGSDEPAAEPDAAESTEQKSDVNES